MTVPLTAVWKVYLLGPCVVPGVVSSSCVVLAPALGVVVPAPPVVLVSCSPVAAAVRGRQSYSHIIHV